MIPSLKEIQKIALPIILTLIRGLCFVKRHAGAAEQAGLTDRPQLHDLLMEKAIATVGTENTVGELSLRLQNHENVLVARIHIALLYISGVLAR